LLESIYEVLLAYELKKRGLSVTRQIPVIVEYDGIHFEEGYRLDLLVEDKVIVEVKSIEKIANIHKKQLLTYLRFDEKETRVTDQF
jgi:GxxExxY protein